MDAFGARSHSDLHDCIACTGIYVSIARLYRGDLHTICQACCADVVVVGPGRYMQTNVVRGGRTRVSIRQVSSQFAVDYVVDVDAGRPGI